MAKIIKKIVNSILRPRKYYEFAEESIKDTIKYTLSIVFVSVYTYLTILYISINNSIVNLVTNEKAAKMTSIGVEQLKEILDFIFKYNIPIFIGVYIAYVLIAFIVSVLGNIILNFNHKCDVNYIGVLKMSMYVLTPALIATMISQIFTNNLLAIEYIFTIIAIYFFIIAYMKGDSEK
ncbi:MAG: hypothetical protein N4A47_06510 [Clostridia bacterium]|jgi:hypothetical protein|nr:hypothetical protein [Clostridia bacterium]